MKEPKAATGQSHKATPCTKRKEFVNIPMVRLKHRDRNTRALCILVVPQCARAEILHPSQSTSELPRVAQSGSPALCPGRVLRHITTLCGLSEVASESLISGPAHGADMSQSFETLNPEKCPLLPSWARSQAVPGRSATAQVGPTAASNPHSLQKGSVYTLICIF